MVNEFWDKWTEIEFTRKSGFPYRREFHYYMKYKGRTKRWYVYAYLDGFRNKSFKNFKDAEKYGKKEAERWQYKYAKPNITVQSSRARVSGRYPWYR